MFIADELGPANDAMAAGRYAEAAAHPRNALRPGSATVDLLAGMNLIPEIPGFARKALTTLRMQGHSVAADTLSARAKETTRRPRTVVLRQRPFVRTAPPSARRRERPGRARFLLSLYG